MTVICFPSTISIGHFEIAYWLARNGVNIRATGGITDKKNTALHLACQNGHIEIVKWLVESGLDINAENDRRNTPIQFAQAGGHEELVKWLTERGSNYYEDTLRKKKQPRLEQALAANDFSLAKKLLEELLMSIEPTSECPNGSTPLHFAAACGHSDLTQHLIICGADINSRTSAGLTPLHFACMKGHTEMAKYLISLGAKINVVDRAGNTPLNLAISSQHIDTYQWLHENGGLTGDRLKERDTRVRLEGSAGMPSLSCIPIQAAVPSVLSKKQPDGGQKQSGSLLFACVSGPSSSNQNAMRQNDFNQQQNSQGGHNMSAKELEVSEGEYNPQLHEACSAGAYSKVCEMLESNEDMGINAQNPIGGSAALHLACVSGNLPLVQLLVEKGAKVDLKNVGGMTPLHIACDRRYSEIALYLIRKGSDILSRNKIGDTPLHKLCARGMAELLESVIDLPRLILPVLDLEVKTDRGLSPLHSAVDQGCLNIVTVLIEQGVQVNPRDEENKTPFHYACIKGHDDIAAYLRDQGAFMNARDNQGLTPIIHACVNEHFYLAKWLASHGANMRAVTDSGDGCLHVACRLGSLEMVSWMMGCNLDPYQPNSHSITPLQIAKDRGYRDIVEYITTSK